MEAVIDKFISLRLKNCAQNLPGVLEQSSKNNLSPLQTIDRLLEIELACRDKARVALRFKQSKLGERTTIDQFDFKHHESRLKQKNLILGLIDLEFVREHKLVFDSGRYTKSRNPRQSMDTAIHSYWRSAYKIRGYIRWILFLEVALFSIL